MSDPKVVAVIVAYHPNLALLDRVIEFDGDHGFQDCRGEQRSGRLASRPEGSGFRSHPEQKYRTWLRPIISARSLRERKARRTCCSSIRTAFRRPAWSRDCSHNIREANQSARSDRYGRIREPERTAALPSGSDERKCQRPGEVLKVEFLISSGSLIGLAALSRWVRSTTGFSSSMSIPIGRFAPRRRALPCTVSRMRCLSTPSAMRFWRCPGPVDERFLYPPERTYYLVRNSIRLWLRPYATWRWRLFDVWRLCRLLVLYLACRAGSQRRIKAILHGVSDAFRPEVARRPNPICIVADGISVPADRPSIHAVALRWATKFRSIAFQTAQKSQSDFDLMPRHPTLRSIDLTCHWRASMSVS